MSKFFECRATLSTLDHAKALLKLLDSRTPFAAPSIASEPPKVASLLFGTIRAIKGPSWTILDAVSAWRFLQASIKALRTRWPTEKINHRCITNILEASLTTKTPFVPHTTRVFNEPTLVFENEHRPMTCGTFAF